MKKVVLLSISVFFVLTLSAQMKILVDNIHGADYIGDSGGMDSLYGAVIDFYSVFPDDELTIMTPDSLPFENILIEETISGVTSKTYELDLGFPYTIQFLYVYAKCSSSYFWERAGGVIKNPEGEVVAELFQGSAHVEDVAGEGWKIELNLKSNLSYDVKIGTGRPLFSSPMMSGKYELSDWDLIVRIMDNCYYALVGNPPLYKTYDLSALGEAFSGGMSFIYADHFYDSMADKPYIHFYSDEDNSVSPKIKFPGFFTLLSDGAKKAESKSEMLFSSEWSGHRVQRGSDNELVYEGALNSRLNFLHFEINGGNVTAKNLIPYSLNDLFILKYHSPGIYKFAGPLQLDILGKAEVTDWQYLKPDQVIGGIEQDFYERGKKEGLTEEEITCLINDFHWIESLLFRARINKDDHFGFYHFGKDVYDKLIGFECEPYPEKLNRTMWVMLSYINSRDQEPVTSLNMNSAKGEIKAGLVINEYGVVDEYYLPNHYQSESELFGISRAGYTSYFLMDYLYFYETDFADNFSNGLSGLEALKGAYDYNHDDYANTGILYHIHDKPSAYGRTINDNGQLVVIGTSYFFTRTFQQGNTFLRTAADALVNGRVLTGIEREDNLITSYNLTAYPNPFNPSTVIKFKLEKESLVELSIYNRNGQQVAKLHSGKLTKGNHTFSFDGSELSSGVYFCRLVSDGVLAARRKVVLLK